MSSSPFLVLVFDLGGVVVQHDDTELFESEAGLLDDLGKRGVTLT